jgi:uncharacterized protein (TIGR02996 family)
VDVHDAALQEIIAHPDDDGPRLIYADWLTDHGNEQGKALGRFIHVQCRLARLPAKDPQRSDLAKEERALQKKYGEYWAASLWDLAAEWVFRRGFIEQIEVKCVAAIAVHLLEHLRAWAPIRHVRFCGDYLKLDSLLSAVHHLAGIETLEMYEFPVGEDEDGVMRELLTSPHLSSLKAMHVLSSGAGDGMFGEEVLHGVLECPHLTNLRRLSLYEYGEGMDDESVQILARSPHLPELEEVDLRAANLNEESLRELMASPHRRTLCKLWCHQVVLGDGTALKEKPALVRELRKRFGKGSLDLRKEYPWWKGQRFTERALMDTPLS